MNDPKITEEIMNQERSRSWLMNPPPTQTAPLAAREPEPDPVPAEEPGPGNPDALTSRGTPRLTDEQLREVKRKAGMLRWARWRARRQGESATESDAAKSGRSERKADYWSRLSPEERGAEMRRRAALRKAKANGQPAAPVTGQPAETPKSSHSLVEQLQAIQAKGEQLAKAAADLLGLIIH